LDVKIVEFLENKGALTDDELFDLLKEAYDNVGFGELNRVLLRLEIEGRIRVSSSIKGKRRVELRERKD
jgi:Fe2+ or Zn2+ uptake regulation protein